jgi:serine/threonine protein kinase
MYRDLKLENILLDSRGHIVLSDFGLSAFTMAVNEEKKVGTMDYLAPECLVDGLYYGYGVDWWAVGILTHELLSGRCPFTIRDGTYEETENNIKREKPIISLNITDPHARSFIQQLLQKKPMLRLGYENGAEDLKKHPFFEQIDWNLMSKKQYPPPIVFNFKDKYDSVQFDDVCTGLETFEDNSQPITSDKNFPG